jgi:hypothetical protein
MIKMTAEVYLGQGILGTLSNAQMKGSGNNISGDIQDILRTSREVSRPFIIGSSRLGSGDTFSTNVEYFIGNQASNDFGIFENPYEITIQGENLSAINIYFDTTNNRYPTEIYIDGILFYNDSPVFFAYNLNVANSHTIVISNWNSPNFPIVISGIFTEIFVEVDKYKTEISCETMYRENIPTPSYNIISNIGYLKFYDRVGAFKNYYESQVFSANFTVNLLIKNTLSRKSEVVATFNSGSWNYDVNTRMVTASLKDDLEEWQEIEIEGFNPIDRTVALDIFNFLKSKTPAKYEFEELDTDTHDYLNRYVRFPKMNKGNLWQQWQKFSVLMSLHIYKNNKGKVCVYHYF